mmetsp:Transcript_17727/g.17895  ORF Transcript_17727/g.17895 Transcript_17727/m.17895 type:complete len:351 (-) Transcript_17727:246-1298(-)
MKKDSSSTSKAIRTGNQTTMMIRKRHRCKDIDNQPGNDDNNQDNERNATPITGTTSASASLLLCTTITNITTEIEQKKLQRHKQEQQVQHQEKKDKKKRRVSFESQPIALTTTIKQEDPMLKGLMAMSFPVKLHVLLATYEKERQRKEKEKKKHNKDDVDLLIHTISTASITNGKKGVTPPIASATTTVATSNYSSSSSFIPIIEWQSNGKSFKINDETRFVKEVMPHYFSYPSNNNKHGDVEDDNHSNDAPTKHAQYYLGQELTSFHHFERNLNLWGFDHMLGVEGPVTRKVHTCSHPLFRRENHELCKSIKFIGDRFIGCSTYNPGGNNTRSRDRSSSSVDRYLMSWR